VRPVFCGVFGVRYAPSSSGNKRAAPKTKVQLGKDKDLLAKLPAPKNKEPDLLGKQKSSSGKTKTCSGNARRAPETRGAGPLVRGRARETFDQLGKLWSSPTRNRAAREGTGLLRKERSSPTTKGAVPETTELARKERSCSGKRGAPQQGTELLGKEPSSPTTNGAARARAEPDTPSFAPDETLLAGSERHRANDQRCREPDALGPHRATVFSVHRAVLEATRRSRGRLTADESRRARGRW